MIDSLSSNLLLLHYLVLRLACMIPLNLFLYHDFPCCDANVAQKLNPEFSWSIQMSCW